MASNPAISVGGDVVFATGPGAKLVKVIQSDGPDSTPAVIVRTHASTAVGTEFKTSDGHEWVKESGAYRCISPGSGETVAIPIVR